MSGSGGGTLPTVAAGVAIVFLAMGIRQSFGLGGAVYDRTGSHTSVRMIAIVLGVTSALIHIPIDDRKPAAIARPQES